ncbi:MAG TPA: TolC family protein [Bacteroidales bacterium]|nr:TolC family protein [Bacteroidales bacterium]
MKRHLLIATIILINGFTLLNGQEKKWTLEECINYAVSNNLNLQRQRLQTDITRADLLRSKMGLLPSINAGSQARMDFGRSVDYRTNLITFNQNFQNSYYISSGITLFSGFTALNTVSANSFMLKAGIETEKVKRNSLIIDILGQYYSVIYSKGLEDASKMQLENSEEQLKRITKMVETGKEALSKQYEMESRVSTDRLDYTVARNTASKALTSLRQMLQIDPGSEFDVVVPELSAIVIPDESFDADSIYNIASEVLPALKAIEYQLKANKRQLAAAKGGVLPNLSLDGGIYTGFAKVIGADSTIAFSDQIKDNNSQQVTLSLNIPIFNNYVTGRSIRVARLRRDETAVMLELEKNSLYTQIENACLDYNTGKDEFLAAQSNLEFNRKSFEAVEKKFESGLLDVTVYSTARTTLFQAEMEALRTRLQLMIRRMSIQFYSTGEYEAIFM